MVWGLRSKGAPAGDPKFWFYVLGIPTLMFAILLGIDRAGFEALWLRAFFRNQIRRKWLAESVEQAQRPLQLLGVGYCLPLGDEDLSAVMSAGRPLLTSQAPRSGAGVITHNRFAEETFTSISVPEDTELPVHPEEIAEALPQKAERVATITLKVVKALEPLLSSLHALSQYGPVHAPTVRILASPNGNPTRVQQVREALRRAGLSSLECLVVPADQGLMVADAWLDAGDQRPLLVIGAEWHDSAPLMGSAEGCVAVLLNPGAYRLPEPVRVAGLLHRPVAGEPDALGDLLKLTLIWGRTGASAVRRTWLTRVESRQDSALLTACKAASLEQLAEADAQRRPDLIVGDVGPLNPWLSIAAAIASGMEGPQLIMDRTQAAVLYITASPHDTSDQ
jgi:hypothetical protein